MAESGIGNEGRYVRDIYALMSLFLLVDPLLSTFVSSSTVLRLLELAVFCSILYLEYAILKNSGAFRYRRWVVLLIVILALNTLSIVLRGKFGGIKDSILMLISPLGAMPYLLPFLILLLPNARHFKMILNVFFYSCLLSLPLWIIALVDGGLVRELYHGEAIGAYFPFFAAFLLGFINQFELKKRVAIVIVFIIYLVLMILNARRNVVLSMFLYAFIAFCSYIVKYVRKRPRKLIGILAVSAVLGIAAIASFPRLASGLLSNLFERGMENTRSSVEMSFLADFATSPVSDTVFGRGLDGTYYHIFIDDVEGGPETDRNVVETEYLNLILKGGIIHVLIVLALLITAIISAFRTKGRPAKYIGLVLVIYLISLYTSTPISRFGVPAIIFWLCVSTSLQLGNHKRRKTESVRAR